MFHFTGRIYLEHEKWYNSKYDHEILYTETSNHPAARTVNFDFAKLPSFKEVVDEKYEGSEQTFWEKTLAQAKNKKFVIFADSALYLRFQAQYWKSIFEDLSAENAYRLHKFYYQDKKLKQFLYVDRAGAKAHDIDDNPFLSFEDYAKVYNEAPIIDAFAQLNKGDVSFEYLLGNYFFDKKSPYAPAFKTKLKNLCWKIWFNDMEILRSELINSFYDINKVIPSVHLDIEDVTSFEEIFKKEPKLRWMQDPDFNEDNIDYVRDTYDSETLEDLAKSFRDNWDLKILSEDKEILSKIKIQDHILPTKKVFEEKYLELLDENIQKNFGCRFVDEFLRNKANQLLPCMIYDKARTNQTDQLSFLKLRRGQH